MSPARSDFRRAFEAGDRFRRALPKPDPIRRAGWPGDAWDDARSRALRDYLSARPFLRGVMRARVLHLYRYDYAHRWASGVGVWLRMLGAAEREPGPVCPFCHDPLVSETERAALVCLICARNADDWSGLDMDTDRDLCEALLLGGVPRG